MKNHFAKLPATVWALLATSALCVSAAADSAHTTAITLQGTGPYHRLTLPAAVYSRAAYTDLRDIRVRNAAGQAVPFAWLGSEASTEVAVSQKVPLFALSSKGTAHTEGLPTEDGLLGLKLRTDGSLALAKIVPAATAGIPAQWLIDVSQVKGSLLQARLATAPGTQGLFAFSLEASDDLRQWRSISRDEQLLLLTQGGQKLERLTVDLGQTRAKFLRLRWTDPAQSAVLTGVDIDSINSTQAAAQTEWSDDITPERCAADYCDYRLPRGVPAHSLRINLADANTLAQVQISGVLDALPTNTTETGQRAPHRNPLYALRKLHHASAPTSAAAAQDEVAQLSTVVYRLTQANGEAHSPALALDAAVYPRLRLRTPGPITMLGATPPSIKVSTMLRTLVFLAQGQAPFALAWSRAAEAALPAPAGAALGLATLFPNYPDYRSNQQLVAGDASIVLSPLVGAPALQPSATSIAPAANNKPGKIWLWAALGGGLLFLAGMAFSLFRSFRKNAPADEAAKS